MDLNVSLQFFSPSDPNYGVLIQVLLAGYANQGRLPGFFVRLSFSGS
jgi:hypothetical protein